MFSKKTFSIFGAAIFASVSSMVPAHANFRAYEDSNFRGAVLADVPDGGYIDVPDDMTSSVRNETKNNYSGQSVIGPWVSHNVMFFVKGSLYENLGPVNDVIDHFDAV